MLKNSLYTKKILSCYIVVIFFTLSSCTSLPKNKHATDSYDYIESLNRNSYGFNEKLDTYFMKPIANFYTETTPKTLRTGINNFFSNISYLNVIMNDFLQGKFEQGVNDSIRFIFNSTLGIGGIFDVATTDLKLEKNYEDFGQTLATWGVSKGRYIYLPMLGPNTSRNLPNYIPVVLLNPFLYLSTPIVVSTSVLSMLNKRSNLIEASNMRDEIAVDPYIFTREAYLQKREHLIWDGDLPLTETEDMFDIEEN